jgi:hypothetical protein
MAGLVTVGGHDYIGNYKLATGHDAIENGMFVAFDFTAGTCSTPVTNAGDAYFVVNTIDTVDEELINDVEFTVTEGKYVRAKKLLPGEVFVTSKAVGTPAVNDVVDVGTTGKITATSGSPAQTFKVIRKPILWGVQCYECIVLD